MRITHAAPAALLFLFFLPAAAAGSAAEEKAKRQSRCIKRGSLPHAIQGGGRRLTSTGSSLVACEGVNQLLQAVVLSSSGSTPSPGPTGAPSEELGEHTGEVVLLLGLSLDGSSSPRSVHHWDSLLRSSEASVDSGRSRDGHRRGEDRRREERERKERGGGGEEHGGRREVGVEGMRECAVDGQGDKVEEVSTESGMLDGNEIRASDRPC